MIMTIQEATDIIRENPERFPSGLDTCYLDVLRFTVRKDIDAQIDKVREATTRFVDLVNRLDGSTAEEVHDAFAAVQEKLAGLKYAWTEAFAPNA